jgi:excisionase family DNA binding protein
MEPLAVSVEEAARLTSLSPRTIRRYVRSGRIQAARVGRRVLVPLESLRALVQERKRG